MTPEQTAIQLIIALIERVGTWSLGSIIIGATCGPELILLSIYLLNERRQRRQAEASEVRFRRLLESRDEQFGKMMAARDEQFRAVVKMYQDNVTLVKQSETNTQDYKDLSTLMVSLVTELKEYIRNNFSCPLVREETMKEFVLSSLRKGEKGQG